MTENGMNYKLAKGKIASERQDFYLESDGTCKWNYMGVVDWNEISEPVTNYVPSGESEELNFIVLGQCDVCGKNPLRYNYILKYTGQEKLAQIADFTSATSPYSIVGSECIESLSHVDMLKVQKDRKKLQEKKSKGNAIALGIYLRDVFNSQHQEMWKMSWKYYGNVKNLGGSVKYLWTKCLEGVPMQEKEFGKELKQALKQAGLEIPDMREIKKIINWNPNLGLSKEEREGKTPDTDGPSYEDYRKDEESIARSESAFERHAEIASGSLNDPGLYLGANDPEPESVLVVPEGMTLKDYYGISPITGKREVLYVSLVNAKTGKEIMPLKESCMDGWDPVIEVPEAVDWDPYAESYGPAGVMYIHLRKWIALNRMMKPEEAKKNEVNPLVRALRAIAGDDQDYASADNGIGFSGFDTEFGHSLCKRDFLTEKQLPYARKMVWKYRKQLQEHFPAIWKEVESMVMQ